MHRNIEALTRYEMDVLMNSNVVFNPQIGYRRRRSIGRLIPTHISPRSIPPKRDRFILEETRRDEFLIGKAKGLFS